MKKLNNSEEQKNNEKKNERREFMKKAVYSAPVVVALGQLLRPTLCKADGTGGPSGPPGGFPLDW